MTYNYEEQEKAIKLLKESLTYIKQAHDEAETRHDTYGEYYMDGAQYDIMQDTEELMSKITEVINDFEDL